MCIHVAHVIGDAVVLVGVVGTAVVDVGQPILVVVEVGAAVGVLETVLVFGVIGALVHVIEDPVAVAVHGRRVRDPGKETAFGVPDTGGQARTTANEHAAYPARHDAQQRLRIRLCRWPFRNQEMEPRNEEQHNLRSQLVTQG